MEHIDQRRQRLVSLMAAKVDRAHQAAGFPPLDTPRKNFVRVEVERLVRSGNVADKDLHRVAHALRAPERLAGGLEPNSARSIAVSQVSAMPSIAPSSGRLPAMGKKRDLWASLALKDVEMYNEEMKGQRAKDKESKRRQKEFLDQQVETQKSLRQAQAEEESVYTKQEADQRQQWLEEQEEYGKRKIRQLEHERNIRDTQLQASAARREREDAARREEEAQIAARIAEDLKIERDIEKDKKLKERQDIARFLDYNKKQKDLKASLAQAEFEADKRYQREYLTKLQRQEMDRVQALRRMYDRQATQANMAFKLQTSLDEQAKADADRARQEAEVMYQRIEEVEQVKRARFNQEKERVKDYLQFQIRQKQHERESERHELEQLKHQLASDVKVAEEKEMQRRQLKRDLERSHRRELHRQIIQRKRTVEDDMTTTEQQMNQRLLKHRDVA